MNEICYGDDCPTCKLRKQAEQLVKEGKQEEAKKVIAEMLAKKGECE